MSGILREKIAEALLYDPDIYVRTNKAAAELPFEVVDCSGNEPIVLSAWADNAEARMQRNYAIAYRRADAARSAIEASGTHAVVPMEPTEEMVANSGIRNRLGAKAVYQGMLAKRPTP